VIDRECLKKDYRDLLTRLQADDTESVREGIFEATVTMMTKTDAATLENDLVPLVMECVQDKSWRVRLAVARNFSKFQKVCPKHVVEGQVASALEKLIHDDEVEIRKEMASKLEAFSSDLDDSNRKRVFIKSVLPLIKDLSIDAVASVRETLAASLLTLSAIVGKDVTIDYLIPTAMLLLKDDSGQVRLNLVSSLGHVGEVVGLKSLNASLIPPILELSLDPKWHVRLEVVNQFPVLASKLGVDFFNQYVNEASLRLLTDPVFDVREATAKALGSLVGTFGTDWFLSRILPQMNILMKDRNYRRRMTILHTFGFVAAATKQEFVVTMILPAISTLSTDKVANIRISVAIILQRLCGFVDKGVIDSHIKPMLEKLKEDADVDVSDFAKDALNFSNKSVKVQ